MSILFTYIYLQSILHPTDRAHRIGQRSDVSVFRLITNSPVEEKILSRATEKLNTAALVVESGKFNKGSVESDNSLERKQLMEILLTDFDNSPARDLHPLDIKELAYLAVSSFAHAGHTHKKAGQTPAFSIRTTPP